MTRQDINKLFFAISTLFPKEQAFVVRSGNDKKPDERSTTMIRMWHSMLGDLDFDTAEIALKVHATKSPFAPSIAELRKEAAAILHPDTRMTEDEAWSYALQAIRNFNIYAPEKAAKGIPSDVWQIVKRMGLADLAATPMDEMGVVRGQFGRMWKAANERQREEAALPAALKEQIAKIGAMPVLRLIGGAK